MRFHALYCTFDAKHPMLLTTDIRSHSLPAPSIFVQPIWVCRIWPAKDPARKFANVITAVMIKV